MLDRVLRLWNPLDISNTRKFFTDLSMEKGYKTVFLLEKYNDGNFRVRDGFFYSGEDFPKDFVLGETSTLVQKLIEENKDEAFVFDEIIRNLDDVLKEKGVVGGMAYSIFIDKELSGILMVCTKDNTARKIRTESIYIEKDRIDFLEVCLEICKKISSILRIELHLRLKDIVLWKKTLDTCEEIDPLLRIVEDSLKDSENFDLIIDILEKAIKKNYDKDNIVVYYERLMGLFIKHLQLSYKKEKELKISSLFLLSYFLSCFFMDIIDKGRKDLCLKNYCCDEQIELYRHFANAIKFYLCNTDNQGVLYFDYKGEEKTGIDHAIFFNAVCYLISEYAYLTAGVNRHLNIEDHLKRFISAQTVLYSLESSYRDHIFHMIDICLFGLFLLRNGFSKILNETSKMQEDDILKNWFIASLLHDVGYVLNIYSLIDEEVKYITSVEINTLKDKIKNATTEGIGLFTSNVLEKLKGINIEIEAGQLKRLDHGVVSALHVLNILEKTSIDKEYLPAISAILMHNLTTKPIDIEKEPVAVLLSICDELQDWERPRVETLPFKERVFAAIRYGGRLSFERSSMMDVIKISLDSEINPYCGEIRLLMNNKLEVILDYREVSKQKDFCIFYPWLLKSFKLQRLDLKGVFDVQITFLSEPRTKKGDLEQLKKNRRKERIWYLEKWLDMVRDDSNVLDDGKAEKVIIRVNNLYEHKTIPVNPEGYLAKLLIKK
jgi:hypothetical protein